ncbi:MAG: hypothetical protein OEY49_06995 [Candidatus Heimdallarchaeota archaeon]|nr:hypothetical protein [Candidatus Heimdallarchaeota archaeon]
MNLPIEEILTHIFLIGILGMIFYYFSNKYSKEQLRITFYWTLAYSFFALSSFLYLAFRFFDNPIIANNLQFISAGIGVVSIFLGVVNSYLDDINSIQWEIPLGIIGLFGILLWSYDIAIGRYIFLIYGLTVDIYFVIISIKSKNVKIAFVTIGLILTLITGIMRTNQVITEQVHTLYQVLAHLLIFVGLNVFSVVKNQTITNITYS